jgi:hypothetical protein
MKIHLHAGILGTLLFALCIMGSATCSARGGERGGYYGVNHYQGVHNYYRNRGYSRGDGYWGNNYWGGGNNAIIIDTPLVGYYSSSCENVQICDQIGNCWMQQSCD